MEEGGSALCHCTADTQERVHTAAPLTHSAAAQEACGSSEHAVLRQLNTQERMTVATGHCCGSSERSALLTEAHARTAFAKVKAKGVVCAAVPQSVTVSVSHGITLCIQYHTVTQGHCRSWRAWCTVEHRRAHACSAKCSVTRYHTRPLSRLAGCGAQKGARVHAVPQSVTLSHTVTAAAGRAWGTVEHRRVRA